MVFAASGLPLLTHRPRLAYVAYTSGSRRCGASHFDGLFTRIAPANPGSLDDVGHAEIIQPPLALLEKEDGLVARAIVITEPDRPLVPNERLPKLEAARLADRFGDEHRLGVTEQIEVGVFLERAVQGLEKLGEPGIGEYRKPVVARCLSVLEPSRRADRAMLFQRLIGRVSYREI